LARPIVLIPHLFRLAGIIIFRKDYSPPSSPPSRPFSGGLREIADEVKSGRVLLVRGSMIYSAGPKGWVGDATTESPSGMGAQAHVYKISYPLGIVY